MKLLLCALLFLCVSASLVLVVRGQADGNACTGTVGKFKYDLSGLSSATGGNDVTCQDKAGNTYYYRPCQPLKIQQCNTISDTSPAACQKDTRKVPLYHDCGSVNQVGWSPRSAGQDKGFFMQFNGGEEDRRLNVEFICDKNAGVGTLETANPTESPTHFYHLSWTTKYACPGGGDGDGKKGDGDDGPAISGGWIFIIVLLSVMFLYLVGGVAYNKFRKDAHGIELIPNHEFWFALPGLVWDGNVYTFKKLRGLCGARYEEM